MSNQTDNFKSNQAPHFTAENARIYQRKAQEALRIKKQRQKEHLANLLKVVAEVSPSASASARERRVLRQLDAIDDRIDDAIDKGDSDSLPAWVNAKSKLWELVCHKLAPAKTKPRSDSVPNHDPVPDPEPEQNAQQTDVQPVAE